MKRNPNRISCTRLPDFGHMPALKEKCRTYGVPRNKTTSYVKFSVFRFTCRKITSLKDFPVKIGRCRWAKKRAMNALINIHTFVIKLTLRFRYRSCFLALDNWLYMNLIAKYQSFIFQGSVADTLFVAFFSNPLGHSMLLMTP